MLSTRIFHPDRAPEREVPLTISIDHASHSIELATVDLDGVHSFGSFSSAADAWRMLDAIEAER